jgi:hypothetical protein
MRWHRRTAVAGLAIAVAGLAGGVAVAASTGTLPTAAGRDGGPSPTTASTAPHTPGSGTANATRDPAAPVSNAASTAPNGQGPDATGPAKFGLCNAFASGQGATNGNKLDSVAFQALATAAGGAGNISAFCAGATPGGNAPHGEGTPPASTSPAGPANDHANPASDAHGPPADAGSNGQSHRP